MSLHLVIEDPSPCPTCGGEGGYWVDEEHGPTYHFPCRDCRCEVCAKPTSTPPLCEWHQREQDDEDAAKAYREGRYE